jgi:uncharacterized membrane protein (UPF0127 family)
MTKTGRLLRTSDGRVIVSRVRWCDSFSCKLRGLMFRRALPVDEGLLLVESHQSRMGVSIHMFFMFFPIVVIWLDNDFTIVDYKLARPWWPFYAPRVPARYVLETHPSLLDEVAVGDSLSFEPLGG